MFPVFEFLGAPSGIFGAVNSAKIFIMLYLRIFETLRFLKLERGADFGRSLLVHCFQAEVYFD